MTTAFNPGAQPDPASSVVSWFQGIDPRLKTHLRRGLITCIAGLLGSIVTILFITFGPRFEEPASVFAAFVLLTFISLLLVALLSITTPLMTLFAYQRLKLSQIDLNSFELQEELDSTREILVKSVMILQELDSAAEADRAAILKKHKDEIAELRRKCETHA